MFLGEARASLWSAGVSAWLLWRMRSSTESELTLRDVRAKLDPFDVCPRTCRLTFRLFTKPAERVSRRSDQPGEARRRRTGGQAARRAAPREMAC